MRVLGVPAQSIIAVVGMLSLIAAYVVPVVTGLEYLNNLYSDIKNLQHDMTYLKNVVDPTVDARQEERLTHLKNIQEQVLAGSTAPQVALKQQVERLAIEVAGQNTRCNDVNSRLNELTRQVDRNTVRMDEVILRPRAARKKYEETQP